LCANSRSGRLHEHSRIQAKALLKKYGVAVPNGAVAYTADEAALAYHGIDRRFRTPRRVRAE
jgi:succinyl-CoA synthetase beta subunit